MGYIGNSPDKTVDVVLDTSPQLGGDLDLNSNNITGTGGIPAANLTGTVANARLDQQLQDVAGLAVTDSGFIVGDGSNFVLETGATVRTSLGLGTAAVLDTGISNTNVPKFTSGVADNDFLRVDGTAIEGRSASEVLSDIGAQASLTFGISNTNAVKIDSASVADDEYARFTANGLESRSTSEVLSDIGAQASLTFGISNTNAVKIDSSSVADDEFARFTANGLESRSTSEVLSDIAAMPLAGGTFTGDVTFTGANYNIVFDKSDDALEFADNAKAKFGAGDDVSMYWDGTDGHLTVLGTLNIDGADGHEMATFADGGAVTLYHNDTARLATTSSGVDVTGDFNASGHVKSEGADGGLIMRSWTNNSSYASLATNGMSGTEYILINNGDTTYLGSGSGGSTVIRGPNNSATAQITVGASQTDVAGPLFVAGKLGLDSTDYIQWTNNTRLDFYVNNSNEFRMESDGDFHADGDVIAFSTTIASDPRLKENVKPVTDAVSKIERLTGYTFDYKHGGSSAGVMSTDVAQVLPSAVSKKALPLKTGDEETKYDVVAYDQLHALLIEAVKELSARVKELENGASK